MRMQAVFFRISTLREHCHFWADDDDNSYTHLHVLFAQRKLSQEALIVSRKAYDKTTSR